MFSYSILEIVQYIKQRIEYWKRNYKKEMERQKNKNYSKPKIKKVLNEFSLDLYDYMKQINSFRNKIKKEKSLHENSSSHLLLPSINREKSIARAKKIIVNPNEALIMEKKAYKLEARINKLQKNNENFWDYKNQKSVNYQNEQKHNSKHEILKSICSIGRQKNSNPTLQIPQPLYYPLNQYQFYPPQFMNYPGFQQQQYYGNNCDPKIEQSSQSSIQTRRNRISTIRMKFLKRRLRVICIAILFIFIFKTYSRTVLYKRCSASLQLQDILNNQYQQLQRDLYKCFEKIDIYKIFVQCTKKMEGREELADQIKIQFQEEQINIDLDVCEIFFQQLLNNIEYLIKKGEFNIFKPIIASFLDGSFPLSRIFLQEEIELLNFHPQFGYLVISPEISKIFIINYFFIKVFVVNMLMRKKLQSVLLKIFKKNEKQHKLALLNGKKMTIILVLFYNILNSIYFSSLKRISSNNKYQASKIKIKNLHQLSYSIKLNNYEPEEEQKNLIKNVQCPLEIREAFIEKFQNNWIIIKNIADLLYKNGLDYKKNSLVKILAETKDNPFPPRKRLVQIYEQRLAKINQSFDQSERSDSSSVQKTNTRKKSKKKK